MVQCNREPNHGGYDFVCISPKCPFDRLVCIDCFKDHPEKMKYMQMNGKDFLRIPKFIEMVTRPNLNAYDYDKIQKIRATQGKLGRLISQFDKQMSVEESKIKQFYKDVEVALVELVRSSLQ